jgi:hypothetical protein
VRAALIATACTTLRPQTLPRVFASSYLWARGVWGQVALIDPVYAA